MVPSSKASHMWEGELPANLTPGTHTVTIRMKDIFEKVFSAHLIFSVG
jgi:hypothetical protein